MPQIYRSNPMSKCDLDKVISQHYWNRTSLWMSICCIYSEHLFKAKIHYMINHIWRSFIKRQTSGTSSDNEWQRVVQRGTTNDNEWQGMTKSGATKDKEWCNEWQRMTTSDNKWQRVTTSGTTIDNKWRRVTTNDNEWHNQWQRVTTSDHFG